MYNQKIAEYDWNKNKLCLHWNQLIFTLVFTNKLILTDDKKVSACFCLYLRGGHYFQRVATLGGKCYFRVFLIAPEKLMLISSIVTIIIFFVYLVSLYMYYLYSFTSACSSFFSVPN